MTTGPHANRMSLQRLYTGAAGLGACVLIATGCASPAAPVSSSATGSATVTAPAGAAQDVWNGDCYSGPTVNVINDSTSTVYVSLQDGPQNVGVAPGADSVSAIPNKPASNSLRITRDGGAIMTSINTDWDGGKRCNPSENDQVTFDGYTDSGTRCFNQVVGVGQSGDDSPRTSSEVCAGRELILSYNPDVDGEGQASITLNGDNWN